MADSSPSPPTLDGVKNVMENEKPDIADFHCAITCVKPLNLVSLSKSRMLEIITIIGVVMLFLGSRDISSNSRKSC